MQLAQVLGWGGPTNTCSVAHACGTNLSHMGGWVHACGTFNRIGVGRCIHGWVHTRGSWIVVVHGCHHHHSVAHGLGWAGHCFLGKWHVCGRAHACCTWVGSSGRAGTCLGGCMLRHVPIEQIVPQGAPFSSPACMHACGGWIHSASFILHCLAPQRGEPPCLTGQGWNGTSLLEGRLKEGTYASQFVHGLP